MKDPLKTYSRQMSLDLFNVIGLQESQSGRLPFVELDGRMIDPYGQDPVLANLSPRQAKEKGLLTSGTYGRPGSTSSNTGRVQRYRSLVNRLRAMTASLGSTLYELTWKERDSKCGRSISALRASALRTSDNDSSSSPNVGACRSAPVRWACVSGRIEASVCCTPPFHSLNRLTN